MEQPPQLATAPELDDDELDEVKVLARGYLALSGDQIAALVAGDELMEVEYAEDK